MDAYTRIADAPLDEYHGDDVGDADHGSLVTTAPLPMVKQDPPTLVIPFTREIKLGSVGKDVVGAKRALDRALGYQVSDYVTPLFGLLAVRKLKKFQASQGLTADGVLGPLTLAKLAPWFDRYGFLLYTGYPPGGTKEDRVRKMIVAYALWGYNHRDQIGYFQFRPMRFMDQLYYLPLYEDCSTFATKAHKHGGAADPNGSRPPYNSYGNTYEERAHGVAVPISMMKPGDLVHYDSPQHVAVSVGGGRVVSHGSSSGPSLRAQNYRRIALVTRVVI